MNNKIKVLVLGKDGMLGSMVFHYLKDRGLDVAGTQMHDEKEPVFFKLEKRYDLPALREIVASAGCNYVINCIGCTRLPRDEMRFFKNNYYLNAVFPQVLQEICSSLSVKVVQMSTDAIYSGRTDAPYYEDSAVDGEGDYALSKIVGEVEGKNALNVRCSIIGREIYSKSSLLNWFLALRENEEIDGYVNHVWNGVTTYQFADFCFQLLTTGLFEELVSQTGVVNLAPNEPIDKYSLLKLFNEVFGKQVRIRPVQAPQKISRVLRSRFLAGRWAKSPTSLKDEVVKMNDFFAHNIRKDGGK
jgi:dTDP-4-dehydrorhamnose reductase